MADDPNLKSRHVVFQPLDADGHPSGNGLPLKLDGVWRRSVGIEPNVNFARARADSVPAGILSSLSPVVGQVKFYFDSLPPTLVGDSDEPSVTLSGIAIVHAEPDQYAFDTAQSKTVPLSYRVAFADARRSFVWPKGGAIQIGERNAEPIERTQAGEGGDIDANGNEAIGPYEAVGICLTAMGLSLDVPTTLLPYPIPSNLEWRMSHAPTELAKLLKATQHVFWMDAGGNPQMDAMGNGGLPEIIPGRMIATVPVAPADTRSPVVVFTSAPNANIETRTFEGIAASGTGWEFVVRDESGNWQNLVDSTWFEDVDPVTVLQDGFSDIPKDFQARVRADLYHCVRLNKDSILPAPLCRYLFDTDENGNIVRTDIDARAKIMQFNADDNDDPGSGLWENSDALVSVGVAMLHDGNVLQFTDLLGKIEDGVKYSVDQVTNFAELAGSDFQVRVSREIYVKRTDGDWSPQFFNIGFQQTANGPVQLNPDDTALAISNPETLIVRRPDLRVIYVDGSPANLQDVTDQATNLAPSFLTPASGGAIRMVFSGYVPVELNGRVEAIEFDQNELTTAVFVDTFFLPNADYVRDGKKSDRLDPTEQYPGQTATAGDRIYDGNMGYEQPTAMVNNPWVQPEAANIVKVKITAPGTNGGMYQGVIVGGQSTAQDGSGAWLDEPEGMTPGTNHILILNLREDTTYVDGSGTNVTQILPIGSEHLGKIVGGTNGTVVEIESCMCEPDPSKGTTFQVSPGSGGTDATASTQSDDGCDRKLINVDLCTRAVWDGSSFSFFKRTLKFECGVLKSVSAETQVAMTTTVACS